LKEQFAESLSKKSDGMKVLIIGLAKSGTSILMYRIAAGLRPCRKYFEPLSHEGQVDVDFHRKVVARPKNAVVKIVYHAGLPERFDEIIPLYDRVVWIIRDPRDQMISSFFYVWYFRHRPNAEQFQRSLALTRQKEADPDSVPFHTLHPSLTNTKRFHTLYRPVAHYLKTFRPQLHVVNYESFIAGDTAALDAYLGFETDIGVGVNPVVRRVSRTRASGNWREWFCEKDVTYYTPLLGPLLSEFGYDPDDWRLSPQSSLPASHGSEYMRRLHDKTPWQEYLESSQARVRHLSHEIVRYFSNLFTTGRLK